MSGARKDILRFFPIAIVIREYGLEGVEPNLGVFSRKGLNSQVKKPLRFAGVSRSRSI